MIIRSPPTTVRNGTPVFPTVVRSNSLVARIVLHNNGPNACTVRNEDDSGSAHIILLGFFTVSGYVIHRTGVIHLPTGIQVGEGGVKRHMVLQQ